TPDGNPWNGYMYMSTQEYFQPAAFTMTDGGTTPLSGAFQATPQKTFALDLKTSAFNALFGGMTFDYAATDVRVILEAGTPAPGVGAFATLLDANVTAGTAYSNPNPACQGAGCDPMMCPSGCDAGTMVLPGDHAHMYSYGNPFKFGQELASVDIE